MSSSPLGSSLYPPALNRSGSVLLTNAAWEQVLCAVSAILGVKTHSRGGFRARGHDSSKPSDPQRTEASQATEFLLSARFEEQNLSPDIGVLGEMLDLESLFSHLYPWRGTLR